MARAFFDVRQIEASSAVVEGVAVNVGSPIGGVLLDVSAQEDQPVTQGQTLFVIAGTNGDGGSAPTVVTAQRSGIVTDIAATQGGYVRAGDRLARIVDNSLAAVRIAAVLQVAPEDLAFIKANRPATVSAGFLGDDTPLPAVISSVGPEYDAKTGTIDVRLRLAQFPPGTHDLPLGAPVRVSMQIENRNRVRTFLTAIAGEQRMKEISDWIASIPAPFTNAQDR
jgi:multidrug efflux pump subunit AcrA (membrane-fusion protein)